MKPTTATKTVPSTHLDQRVSHMMLLHINYRVMTDVNL